MGKTGPAELFSVDVIPLVPLRFARSVSYTYLSEAAVPKGSLVSVPFGRRRIRGVVAKCRALSRAPRPGRFKHIESVIAESFLTAGQSLLAERIAKKCFTGLSKTLVHFLPPIVKERSVRQPVAASADPVEGGILRSAPFRRLTSGRKRVFLWEARGYAVLRVASAWQAAHPEGQTLVLVPELIAIPDAERFLTERFGNDRVSVLHSRLSKGRFFASWQRVRDGDASVIVGTRQALFSPFRRLTAIFVLDEDESVGYQQWDMSPRYDARIVARDLAEMHRAKLIFASVAPRLETIREADRGSIIRLPIQDDAPQGAPIVVDMRKERWKKRTGPISEALEAALVRSRRDHTRALVLVSRSGIDSFSVCNDCRLVASCPRCGRALRSRRDGTLSCPECLYRSGTFPRCRGCGSLSFRSFGTGTEKVEREIARILPGARIVRIDEGTAAGSGYARVVELSRDADVVVGTPSSLSIPSLSDLALVAIIDAGSFLSIPDFRTDERMLATLRKSRVMLSDSHDLSLVAQAFRPEQPLIAGFADGRIDDLFARMYADRETLRYPPFSRILKVIVRGETRDDAARDARSVAARLKEAASGQAGTDISDPVIPVVERVRGRYERFIVIRLPEDGTIPADVSSELTVISPSVVVEPDPFSLS